MNTSRTKTIPNQLIYCKNNKKPKLYCITRQSDHHQKIKDFKTQPLGRRPKISQDDDGQAAARVTHKPTSKRVKKLKFCKIQFFL